MNTVFFLVLRQMRAPLLLLSAVYAMATLGMTLMPGVDDKGNVWHMDFFHAFYFISFMGTTTGFGEIPYPFTGAQRLWAVIFIYITVATWVYTIGALIALLSSESLQSALTRYRFQRHVRNIREPFTLICGYGDTGSKLVNAISSRMMQATVIEILPERIDELQLASTQIVVPGLCGDARDPGNLIDAGIENPWCESIVAITNDNAVNLHIAITAKVINPSLQVICRADSHEIEANMASFGTEYIIDPFDTFANNLGQAIYAPAQYLLANVCRGEESAPIGEVKSIPEGRWIICGYGRFGRALYEEMTSQGLNVQVVESNADMKALPRGTVIGLGTEAGTLNEAGINDAVGIIAGTNDDSNNLSIIVTALQLNPSLFTIIRQNEHMNRPLMDHSGADIVMEPSRIVAEKIRTVLVNQTVDDFLSLARANTNQWAQSLLGKLREHFRGRMPAIWQVRINEHEAQAVIEAIERGETVRIGDLLVDHTDRERTLRCVPLFHADERGAFCQPAEETVLEPGDVLLFAGRRWVQSRMKWTLLNETALSYVLNGKARPATWFGRWLAQKGQDSPA